MYVSRLIVICFIALSLVACQAVVPIAAANFGIVASEEQHIGDHSIPQNATYIGVSEGHTYLGGVALGDKLNLWVIPYNGRHPRQNSPQGPFVIAIQAWDLKYAGARSIRLAPNVSYLRLGNGEMVRPIGYRAIPRFSTGAHCYPGGSPTPSAGDPLNTSKDSEEFIVRGASPCIEVFFNTPIIDPGTSFTWGMPVVTEGERVVTSPRELSFVKHYGR
jgi:hypothetical protein